MKHSNGKPDIAKIVICGIPLLLIVWAAAFLLLAYFTRDIHITKYGAFSIFFLSIPLYFFLSVKYAHKIEAVIDLEEEQIRSGEIEEEGTKIIVTKRHLLAAGTIIVLFPAYIYIGQIHFNLSSNQIKTHLLVIGSILALVEVIYMRIFQNKRKKNSISN